MGIRAEDAGARVAFYLFVAVIAAVALLGAPLQVVH